MSTLDPFDFGPEPAPRSPYVRWMDAWRAAQADAQIRRLLDLTRPPAPMPQPYLAQIGGWGWHYLASEFQEGEA